MLLACSAGHLCADVILTAQNLNEALKAMARLQQQSTTAPPVERAEAVFALGLEADALASLLSEEVIAHGMQEKPLIDLALERTRELGVVIAYSREKKKFFYDGAAFPRYLALAPRGPQAARAQFKVIEGEFYQSSSTDVKRVLAAVERKKAFLARYPSFELNVEVSLMLAIDYRDLFRYYDEEDDAANRNRYRDLVRRQLRATMRRYPGTEQAGIAEKLLERFEEQLGRGDTGP